MNRFNRELHAADDLLCDQIRDDFRDQRDGIDATIARMRRWLHEHPSISHRAAALDQLIRCTIDGAAGRDACTTTGAHSRVDAARAVSAAFPDLRDAIDAAIFLDSVFTDDDLCPVSVAPAETLTLPISLPGADGSSRYDLLRVIDEGADGRVYFAVDRLLGSGTCAAPVAVKVFRDATRTDVHSLIDEARRVRRIHHPAVIRVYDAGDDTRIGPYIVYEHCDGEPLSRCGNAGSLRADRARMLHLFSMIARGVGAIHRSGVSHGDLHPGNIIIDRDGQPRVIDLGIGRSLARARTGAMIGALGFTAPEIITSDRTPDGQPADIYSIGAMLHWALTGFPPHGDSPDTFERWLTEDNRAGPRDHRVGQASRPSSADARIRKFDAQVAHVIARALSRDPADRYSSADDLANDLDRCRRLEPIPWTKPPSGRRLALAYRRAPRSWIAGSAIVTIAVIAVVAAVLAQSRARAVESARSLDVAHAELAANNAALAAANSELETARQAQSVSAAMQRYVRATLAKSPSLRWLVPLLLLDTASTSDTSPSRLLETDRLDERIEMLRTILSVTDEDPEHDLHRIIAQGLLASWLESAGRRDEARRVAENTADLLRAFEGDRSNEMDMLRAIISRTNPSPHAAETAPDPGTLPR